MDAALPPPSPANATPQAVRVSFTGDGREYFRIWIVNVLLTIVTLGVFSAWAKVRRLQYFHRNTRLAGASFDYHGDPVALLKGRIVGVALFALYLSVGFVRPLYAALIIAGIAIVMPWLISRSLRFRLHNSSYRGLRFRFSGSTRSAYWVFLGLPVATLLSLFTLGPFWHHRIKRYQFANASFGGTPFTFSAQVSGFYSVYIAALVMAAVVVGALGGALATAAVMAVAATGGGEHEASAAAAVGMAAVTIAGFAIYVVGIVSIQAFVFGRVRNLSWSRTTLGTRRFNSDIRARRLAWLLVSNLVATIATLGLFWPFGQIRLTRCLTQAITMEGDFAFEDLAAASSPDETAIGEEVSGFFDFDIAF